jgi:hypothetical protein
MLPVDFNLVNILPTEMAVMRAYCRYRRSRIVAPSLARFERTFRAWKGLKLLRQMARSLYHRHQLRALLLALCTSSSTMRMSSNIPEFQERHRRRLLRFGHPPIRH